MAACVAFHPDKISEEERAGMGAAEMGSIKIRSQIANWLKTLIRDGQSIGVNGRGGNLSDYIRGKLFLILF